MAPIVHTVEIDRAPKEVFDYVTDPSRFTEWQDTVSSARAESSGALEKGSRIVMTRVMPGGREQTMTSEYIEFDPPRTYSFRVIDGPVRAFGTGTLESIGEGNRTRFTMELDFEGHGIGKLLVPLVVRRGAKKELDQSHQGLKRALEASPEGD